VKIAVVTETFAPFRGGSARRYHEVFKRLARNHEVHLYTPRLSPAWAENEDIDGIHVHRSEKPEVGLITKEGLRSLRTVGRFTLWSFHRVGKDGPYDVIEANHCPVFPALGSWLRSRIGHTPLSVTFHEVWYNEWFRYVPHRVYAPVGIGLERSTTMVPDRAIAVSDTTANGLESIFGLPKEKIRIISNGVNPLLFSPGRKRDDGRVVFVGRLNPHKRLDLLLGAVEGLVGQYSDLNLHVVGDGPWAKNYKALASSRILKERVTFVGAPDDMGVANELMEAKVYVQSSIREGQSITVLEAMAAGTPQVAVKAPGSAVPELLSRSGSGVEVEASSRSIASGISSLLGDEGYWGKLSQNSLKYAQNCTWDAIAKQHERLYEEMASNRRR
jgi:glycosyltransferase involved in cell wall biosynthesis